MTIRPTDTAFERLLVVEDCRSLAETIQLAVAGTCPTSRIAATVAEALEHLTCWQPDLLVLDVALPDGSAFEILDALRAPAHHLPIIAISGSASPKQTFELARRGVREFLAKPLDIGELRASVAHLAPTPELDARLREAVGLEALVDLEAHVRRVMVQEALERSGGSLRAAARLLGISRQNLQYILRTQLA